MESHKTSKWFRHNVPILSRAWKTFGNPTNKDRRPIQFQFLIKDILW